VRVERIEPMRVAFMRHVGPYDEVGSLWGKFMAWAGAHGLLSRQPMLIGIGHDDPHVTPADRVRYDACIPVDERFQPEGDVGVQEIPGGDYAVTTHRGPYEKLGETYARLCGEWLPASGRELRSAPPFEVYRNSPMNAAPADLITDIHLPLEE
jgi:AraC family transcriptional regulator